MPIQKMVLISKSSI